MMLGPLVLLAILSVIGGFAGVGNRFEHFLAPVIQNVEVAQQEAINPAIVVAPANEGEGTAGESKGLETTLMWISVAAGLGGLALAWFMYISRPELPARAAASLGGLYKLVLNKYWIDELYGAVLIGPLLWISRKVLWQSIDQIVIDGTVDEAAIAARDVSAVVRQQQSGLVRSYAGWVAAGAALVVAYMVWMGTR